MNSIEKSADELFQEALEDAKLESDIDEALAHQNAKEIKWHHMYAVANAEFKALKNRVEKTKAKLALELRSGKVDVDFKITDATASQWALVHPKTQKAIKKLVEAEKMKVLLEGIKKDFEDRKDILVSLSANFRSELDHDIYIVKKSKEVNPGVSFNPKQNKTKGGH